MPPSLFNFSLFLLGHSKSFHIYFLSVLSFLFDFLIFFSPRSITVEWRDFSWEWFSRDAMWNHLFTLWKKKVWKMGTARVDCAGEESLRMLLMLANAKQNVHLLVWNYTYDKRWILILCDNKKRLANWLNEFSQSVRKLGSKKEDFVYDFEDFAVGLIHYSFLKPRMVMEN